MQPRRSPIRHQPPRPSRDDLLRPQGHSCLHHRLCRLSTRRSPRRFAQTCRQSPPPLRKRRQRKFLLHPRPPLTVFLGFSVVVTFFIIRCLCALCLSNAFTVRCDLMDQDTATRASAVSSAPARMPSSAKCPELPKDCCRTYAPVSRNTTDRHTPKYLPCFMSVAS